MRTVTKVDALEAAKKEWYERLTEFMVGLINLKDLKIVLEAGCGSGRLTLPLMAKLDRRCKIVAYDFSAGPYKGDLEILKKAVVAEKIENEIEFVKGDVRDMKAIAEETVDLIVSNELFCDLEEAGLKQALKEFYRILKHGGQMVHAELSPVAENEAQRLLIEANLYYSLETMLPEGAYWFSPTVDDVAALMHKIGFRDIQVRFFETDLRLVYEVAVEQLRQWRIDERFVKKYEKDLREYGIEFPLEHVIFCEKVGL